MRFCDIREKAKSLNPLTLAVAAAHDEPVLEAALEAAKMGMVRPILIGDRATILKMADDGAMSLDNIEIIDEKDGLICAARAVDMVRMGEANILMKGMMQTADLLRAVLNKEKGLRSGRPLSHVLLIESPLIDRMIFMTDVAMVMYPDIKTKADLIRNAAAVASSLGVATPKVACLAALETVNPDMPPTMDAAILTVMNQRGQIKGCVVDGPLAMDNALSMEAARHKGIDSPVAGQADVLLVPNIEAGNICFKALTFMGGCATAGIVAGAGAPIVLTSRTDSAESKLNSIACAALSV